MASPKGGGVMGAAERRSLLLKKLRRRRYDKILNLAEEFGVSARTIRRDIEALSLTEPLYTQAGRHGGVYMIDTYLMEQIYFSENENRVLCKLLDLTETHKLLTFDETKVLKRIIIDYSIPNNKKEGH